MTNKKPTVSVIVPVYNVCEFLSGCLDSILAQTFVDYEIICVNDGSTDNSGHIADSYAAKEKRIRVIHQKNKGLSGARNAGLDVAEGEYISFLDSDDYIHPQFLEKLIEIARREKTDIVSCQLVHTKEKYEPIDVSITDADIHITRVKNPFERFLDKKDIITNVCVKLYRRAAIGELRFIEGVYFEDIPFTTMIMMRVQSMVITNLPFYFYYRNMSSIMRSSFSIQKVKSYITVIRQIDAYICEHKPDMREIVREKILNKRFKMMINQAIRKQRDKKKRLELFNEIQMQIKPLFAEGIISYQGLKFYHKIALYLLLRMKTGKAACMWMAFVS